MTHNTGMGLLGVALPSTHAHTLSKPQTLPMGFALPMIFPTYSGIQTLLLSRMRGHHRVRYPWVDQAIGREAEVECGF